jgi:hypothetical protein
MTKNRVVIGTHHVGVRKIIAVRALNAREMRRAFKF